MLIVAFVTIAGPQLVACVGTGGGGSAVVELAAAPRPYATDVPLVKGFKLVDQSSEDWASGEVRYLRHRYLGRADEVAVREFYRRQMPLVRWMLLSDGQVKGRYNMRFERGAESCIVEIAEVRHGLSRRIAVDILITPILKGDRSIVR